MLRVLFVFAIVFFGAYHALRNKFYAVLFYLWNGYFRPEAWVWDDRILKLKLSYTIGLYATVTSFFGEERIDAKGRNAIFLLFLLQCLWSTLAGVATEWSWIWWKDFAKASLICLLIISYNKDIVRLRQTIWVMTLSLGFEASKQGWAQLLTNPGGKNENEIPFLGDNNGVAVGVLMLVPMLGVLSRTATNKWEGRLFSFLILGTIYRAISTYSRGAFLTAGTLMAFTLARSKQKIRLVLGIVAICAAIYPALPQSYWDRMSTIQAKDGKRDDSSASRLHFWVVAVHMANAYPLTGVGFNAYDRAYNRFDFLDGRFGRGRSVHSVWFGTLSEVGYLGMAFFMWFFYEAYKSCARARRLTKGRPEPQLAAAYDIAGSLQAALTAFCVGATFVPMQWCEMLWHFFALTFAVDNVAQAELRRLDEAALRAAVDADAAAARTGGDDGEAAGTDARTPFDSDVVKLPAALARPAVGRAESPGHGADTSGAAARAGAAALRSGAAERARAAAERQAREAIEKADREARDAVAAELAKGPPPLHDDEPPRTVMAHPSELPATPPRWTDRASDDDDDAPPRTLVDTTKRREG